MLTGSEGSKPPLSLVDGTFVGVDIGGSSTRVAVVANGVTDLQTVRMRGNLLLGESKLLGGLRRLCERIRPDGIAVGIPGLRHVEDGAAIVERALLATGVNRAVVVSDAAAAHLGAFAGGDGVVVCAGTGSVAAAGTPSELVLVGGHGYLLGDAGGAYSLGRCAVLRALQRRDLGQASALAQAIEDAVGCSLLALAARVHTHPSDRQLLAQLAPLVCALQADDADAEDVIAQASDSLAALGHSAAQRVGVGRISYSGGVFSCDRLRTRFVQLTSAIPPEEPPHVGVLRALELA